MSKISGRKFFDKLFKTAGFGSMVILALCLCILLGPIMFRGFKSVVFQGTVEHRKVLIEQFDVKASEQDNKDIAKANLERQYIYDTIANFEEWLSKQPIKKRREISGDYEDFKKSLCHLIGPLPGDKEAILLRYNYGANRMDMAKKFLSETIYREEWEDVCNEEGQIIDRQLVKRSRELIYSETPLANLFSWLEINIDKILIPRWTFYWRFFTTTSKDSYVFGGIWTEILGTFYLTFGAMLIAVPIGILSAVYLVEYAKDNWLIKIIRSCIGTLAGVPSVVFGLFGLAFFINTLHLSNNKSVMIGALTLALLILPTIIRSSEEAINAIPKTYKEAALALGASHWKVIISVLLPAALPGILTGIIISMGRAAGETAPIMFTAAVSVGKPLSFLQIFNEPTPALPWNIYNLATEHEAQDLIVHVQYGMVATLVGLVFLLNLTAIIIRYRLSKKQ